MRTKFNGNGKNKGGRPSKYDPDKYPHMAREATKAGMTDVALARLFNVSIQSIDGWKREHPEFLKAIKEGKDKFDSDRVENALLDNCIGYEYDEVRTEEIVVAHKDKKYAVIPAMKVTRTRKKVEGKVSAQQYWLQNRNPDRWKYIVKQIEGSIKLEHEGLEKLERRKVEQLWNAFKREGAVPKKQSSANA